MSNSDQTPMLNAVVADSKAGYITLQVAGQDGYEINLRIKKTVPMGQLMNSYCERLGIEMADLRFCFDGQRIDVSETPEQLKLINGDLIEVFQRQIAGRKPD